MVKMLSCSVVNFSQASTYFEHTSEYYTQQITNYDRWHGSLAQVRGLVGELSKEQFDESLQQIREAGRGSRAGLDCTFSAPKSVSLAMAADEQTRKDMIACHQAAVDEVLKKIEIESIHTRVKKKDIISGNMQAAEFLHFTSRPTRDKDYISDLSLHSHCILMNTTFTDGQDCAVNYGNILRHNKDLGLEYRVILAQKLQEKGYKLTLTDARNGYFELAGFDRGTVLEYSSREQQLKKFAVENGITDLKKANLMSREKKSTSKVEISEIMKMTQQDLFVNKKIQIQKVKIEGDKYHERSKNDKDNERKVVRNQSELQDDAPGDIVRDVANLRQTRIEEAFIPLAERDSLQDMQTRAMDVPNRQDGHQFDLLLSANRITKLAELQETGVCNYFVRKARTARGRLKNKEHRDTVDALARKVIKGLASEKFAFSVLECRRRIMAAGVLLGITEKEAIVAMQRAKLIALGQLALPNGKKSKDRFLTTQENIEKEQALSQHVIDGKDVIQDRIFSRTEAEEILHEVEDTAVQQGLTDFRLTNPPKGHSDEQAQAIYHILTCADRFVAVDGLAGTGKTTMCERLNWIAQKTGIKLVGMGFSGKAADGLQSESGIESSTIHSFLGKITGDRATATNGEIKQEWDCSNIKMSNGREIWVVDEAGLLDNNLMFQLQNAAIARKAQVLLLGDPLQLPPVGSGEPMKQMEQAGMATAQLSDIRRQQNIELLQAVQESVQGDQIKTFKILEHQKTYHEIKEAKKRKKTIIEKMTQTKPQKYLKNGRLDKLLLVTTNADRNEYNRCIREQYVSQGVISKGKQYTITSYSQGDNAVEQRYFSTGDRIIFNRNDNRLKVKNGTLGVIIQTNGNVITVQTDTGRTITVDMSQYNAIDYSYAVTSYRAQGMTVNQVLVDMNTHSAVQTRNALYVNLSRAKFKAEIWTDDKRKLERDTKNFVKKITSQDFIERINAMKSGITNNDRYHDVDTDESQALKAALKRIKAHIMSTPQFIIDAKAEKAPKQKGDMDYGVNRTKAGKRSQTKNRAGIRDTSGGRGR